MAQIGTKKMRYNGTTVSVPIHPPNEVAYPVRRIAIGGQVGCLPVFPLSENAGDLAFESRRLYHPIHGIMAYHDAPVLRTLLDSFEYNTDTLHNRYVVSSTKTQAGTETFAGALDGSRVAFLGVDTSASGMWTIPADSRLPQYPAPGKRFAWHFRVNEWSGAGQSWFTFGGTESVGVEVTDQTHYEVNLIEAGSGDAFRLRVRETDSNGNVLTLDTVASAEETHGQGNLPDIVADQWYCMLVDWYGQSADGRTGVQARLYDVVDPDPATDTPIQFGSFDTADYPHGGADGSSIVPQEAGRMGVRQSGTPIVMRTDQWQMYPDR